MDSTRDEQHWHEIARRYDLEPGPINLENGYFGRMSRAVLEQYQDNVAFINRSNSIHVRQRFEQGENVSDRMVLANVATACGYDQAEVLKYLDSDEDVSLIRDMEHEARTWGVNSVPTFIFDRKSGIQGAEDPSVLANEIKQVLASSKN